MKVKCLNIYDEHTRQYKKKSAYLTIGKEYVVLEIMISAEKGSVYRLVDDNENEMPGLYNALQFEIVSDLTPPNWEISIANKKLIILGPKEWRKNAFWDAYYEDDPKALKIYKHETKIIYNQENVS